MTSHRSMKPLFDDLPRAKTLPLAFAQVREDSELDAQLASQLKPERTLMIASGGCTLALLVARRLSKEIVAVDVNQAQLALSKLKLNLLSVAAEERLSLLGHEDLTPQRRAELLNPILDRASIDPRIFGPESVVYECGLDYGGRYEWLFSQLKERLITWHSELKSLLESSSPLEQLARHEPFQAALRQAFREIFSLPVLQALFGEDATQNSATSFDEHFWIQFMKVAGSPLWQRNPFVRQLLFQRFPKGSRYAWIDAPICEKYQGVTFEHAHMLQYLQHNIGGNFDFVHLSNILDWLSLEQATELLVAARGCLSKRGFLFIRQLNSSTEVQALDTGIKWDRAQSEKFLQQDRSFFYRRLHLGSPKH